METQLQTPKRLIAIGDVHGEAAKLKQLLEAVAPQADDQLVFIGDYVDRGRHCRQAIDLLLDLQQELPHTVFLRGNHDQMLLDALIELHITPGARLREQSPLFAAKGPASDLEKYLSIGQETLASYGISNLADFPREHIAFLECTRTWWRHGDYIFVHAGADSQLPLHQQDPYILLWERNSLPGQHGQIHVVGHQPTQGEISIEAGRINVDTGAVYGQRLSAYDLLNQHLWQVG